MIQGPHVHQAQGVPKVLGDLPRSASDSSWDGCAMCTAVAGAPRAFTFRFGLNSKREGLYPTSGSYRQRYRQPVVLASDSHR